MIHQFEITIPRLTGDIPRRAYVYVPHSYEKDPGRRYPVLYMFDGHNVFFDSHATYGKSWGMGDYLDYTDTDLIVAAVECNHSPDNGRLREYSPFTFDDPALGHIEGRGRETMDWYVDVFKPEIDRRFPTLPDRANTFIGGSSMGGLMSLYAALEYNEVFSKAAALSPSVWCAPDQTAEMIRNASIRRDTVIYMDYGSEEMQFRKKMARHYGRTAALLMEKGVYLTSRIVPGGKHCEASWERQIPYFMSTLFYNP
ncbi:MAG: alpha/beta hydrolase [Oscillospiraceae bacterium]|nr:alpha/beta hydrolase [Oscillospiraceae bacterium]